MTFDAKDFAASLDATGWSEALIKSDKTLMKTYNDAVAGKWTPDRFASAIKNTAWYKARTESMRQFDALKLNDPAAFKAQFDAYVAKFKDQFGASGVAVDPARLTQLATAAMRTGSSDNQLQDMIAAEFKYDPKKAYGGTAGQDIDQVRTIASDYGVNITDAGLADWTKKILSGDTDIEGFKAFATQQATSKYSWLKPQLDAGQTIKQLTDPYKQAMGQILEISPDAIDNNDPTVARALQYDVDNKGTYALMPQWKFVDQLRADPRWAQTDNARQSVMGAGYKVLQDFGLVT